MRLLSRSCLLICLFGQGCGLDVGVARAPVVYGVDDRDEVFEHSSAAHRTLALSAIAMQVDEGWIDETTPSDVRITYTQTLGEAQTLCAGERFADQIEPGTCSGTLIDGRHVLTAGHCVADPSDCDGASAWVFGFAYERAGALRTLTSNDVYRCARVHAYRDDSGGDHAVVELDRNVVGHVPATLSSAAGGVGTAITLIGHPNGIPMKIAAGASVVAVNGPLFDADVDAFSGNSGSGVFDGSAGFLGILNSGADDYVARGGCNVVNVETVASTGGETLTYARVAIAAFCAEPGVVSVVCGDAVDAGSVAPDGGSPSDAGSAIDSGAAFVDAGTGDPAPGDCACSASAPRANPRPLLGLCLLLAVAFARQKRRLR